ncbi:hypothetical protein G9A89_002693 [Geosiphon pyriformis]|nr:hypothetical protein G9A89_002693 [Geosiphon pyriformis]
MSTCIKDNKEWPTTTKYYCRPCIIERFRKLKQQGKWDSTLCLVCSEILLDEEFWNNVPGRRGTCDEYCDKCDLMFNSLPRTLHLINELPEPKEEAELIVEDMPFQEPNEATETE